MTARHNRILRAYASRNEHADTHSRRWLVQQENLRWPWWVCALVVWFVVLTLPVWGK